MTPAVARMITIICSVVVVLLQILIAPHVAIGSAIPNFIVVLCVVVAVMNSRNFNCLLPFVLGLIYDIISGGPIGAMAFCLTALSVATAWFHDRIDNDTVFMGLLNLCVGIFLVELAYGIFLLIFGYRMDPVDGFVFRVVPCFVYDLVLAVIVYLVVNRFFKRDETSQPMIRHLS